MVTKRKLYDSGRPWCRVWLNRFQVKTGRPPCTGGPLMAVAVNAEARRKSDTCNKGQEFEQNGGAVVDKQPSHRAGIAQEF